MSHAASIPAFSINRWVRIMTLVMMLGLMGLTLARCEDDGMGGGGSATPGGEGARFQISG